jgi:hypothetical protein
MQHLLLACVSADEDVSDALRRSTAAKAPLQAALKKAILDSGSGGGFARYDSNKFKKA